MLMNGLSRSFESQLSEQLHRPASARPENATTSSDAHAQTPQRPLTRVRSQSDADKRSPSMHAVSGDLSRDDSSIPHPAGTSMRKQLQPALSLQPPPALGSRSPLSMTAPLSPKLDSSHIYASSTSVLPRRSRGIEFSRACTHLHHSTLAESSPDTSPVIASKGVNIPHRRGSHGSAVLPLSNSGQADRTAISSSVSSVNMLELETTSSEEEDDDPMGNGTGDRDDMLITPQAASKFTLAPPATNNLFATANSWNTGNDWTGGYSQAATNLMSFQRARIGKNRSRHSSSSGSGTSAKPSPGPGPLSPPVFKSIENPSSGGYFASRTAFQPPRGLNLQNDLRVSDVGDDGNRFSQPASDGSKPDGGAFGVVRRAVTRRSNLLVSDFDISRSLMLEEKLTENRTSPKPRTLHGLERPCLKNLPRLTVRRIVKQRLFDRCARVTRMCNAGLQCPISFLPPSILVLLPLLLEPLRLPTTRRVSTILTFSRVEIPQRRISGIRLKAVTARLHHHHGIRPAFLQSRRMMRQWNLPLPPRQTLQRCASGRHLAPLLPFILPTRYKHGNVVEMTILTRWR